jgi:hypothetical protein
MKASRSLKEGLIRTGHFELQLGGCRKAGFSGDIAQPQTMQPHVRQPHILLQFYGDYCNHTVGYQDL